MDKVVNVSETDLQSVVDQVIQTGQELVVGQDGKPLAKLIPVKQPDRTKRLGCFAGQIHMADDFDEWPEEEARALGIIDEDAQACES